MKVVSTIAAALLLTGATLFAGTSSAVSVTSGNRNLSVHGYSTSKGILVGGSVKRILGLGSGGGSIRVCVFSPEGRMVSCKTTHVSYPNRRPIIRSGTGSFAILVQAAPGSTIRVGGYHEC